MAVCLQRFTEIQSRIGRNKHDRLNQGSNFLESSFTNRGNVKVPNQSRRDSQPQHILKYCFLSRTDPSIFTSIAPLSLDQSNELSSVVFPALKSTSHFLPQSTRSYIQIRLRFRIFPQEQTHPFSHQEHQYY